MVYLRYLVFLLSLLLCGSLTAQEGATESVQRTISGKVIDKQTKEAIPFVYILLAKEQDRGVLSNENGEYTLPYTEESLGDTILVSRLGYKLFKLALRDLRPNQRQLIIELESSSIQIDAVTVRAAESPEQIIRMALKRIDQNYGYQQSQARAFYEYLVPELDRSPTDGMHLVVMLKDIRQTLRGGGGA